MATGHPNMGTSVGVTEGHTLGGACWGALGDLLTQLHEGWVSHHVMDHLFQHKVAGHDRVHLALPVVVLQPDPWVLKAFKSYLHEG